MGKLITLATLAFLAVTAKGQNLAYIVNQSSNSVSVMNTVDETIVQTIPVGKFPVTFAVSPDGTRGYVTLGNDFSLAVIDLATNAVIDSIPLSLGVWKIAISPDGARAWITNVFGTVAVVNLGTKATESVIPVGSQPTDVALTPDGSRAYVSNQTSSNISVIDTATRAIIATIPVGAFPLGLAITPDGKKVYVASNGGFNVSVINTALNTTTATIPIPKSALHVAINPLGTRAYIATFDGVSVIDVATDAVVANASTGFAATEIAVTPDGKRLFLANRFRNSVTVFDTASNTVVETAPAGAEPASMAIPRPASGLSSVAASFYPQAIATTSPTQTLTFTNPATIPLSITSIVLSGSDFSQMNNCGVAIAPLSSCAIMLSFTPSVLGASAGSLTLTDTAAGSPQTVTLTGTGINAGPPLLLLSQTSLTFTDQIPGTTSAGQVVKISNPGAAPLTITSITASGDFVQVNNCVKAIPATASCSIIVSFAPQSAGPLMGSINIVDNAAGAPYSIALTGVGAQPALRLSTQSLVFPNQVVGAQGPSETVTLTNIGLVPVIFYNQPNATSPFFITSNTCTSLSPGSSCVMAISFLPHGVGTFTATLQINDNVPNTQAIALSGTGFIPPPVVSLSTDHLAFAIQPTGTTSGAQSVLLSNVGTSSLAISGIFASPQFAQTNLCGASLAPGASCTISVTFLPQKVGPQSGAISIFDNATPSIQTITLIGSSKGLFEAESGVNSLSGPARAEPCAGCSGGSMVTHLGSDENGMITFNGITASAAQMYTLIVAYLNGSSTPRTLSLSVNGGASMSVSFPGSGSWDGIPAQVSVQVLLQVGNNTVSFSNPSAPGPNLDQITIQ